MKLEVEFTREQSLGVFLVRGSRVFEEAVRFRSDLASRSRTEDLAAALIRAFTCEAEARRWLDGQQRALSAGRATDAQGA